MTTEIGDSDDFDVCRTCGVFVHNHQRYLHPFFGPQDNELINRIVFTLGSWGVAICKDDGYPQNICSCCLDRFNQWFSFKKSCIDTQEYLKLIVNFPKPMQSAPLVKQERLDDDESDAVVAYKKRKVAEQQEEADDEGFAVTFGDNLTFPVPIKREVNDFIDGHLAEMDTGENEHFQYNNNHKHRKPSTAGSLDKGKQWLCSYCDGTSFDTEAELERHIWNVHAMDDDQNKPIEGFAEEDDQEEDDEIGEDEDGELEMCEEDAGEEDGDGEEEYEDDDEVFDAEDYEHEEEDEYSCEEVNEEEETTDENKNEKKGSDNSQEPECSESNKPEIEATDLIKQLQVTTYPLSNQSPSKTTEACSVVNNEPSKADGESSEIASAICSRTFPPSDEELRHHSEDEREPAQTNVCGICSKSFSLFVAYRNHMKRKHPGAELVAVFQ